MSAEIGKTLARIWKNQKQYNTKIQLEQADSVSSDQWFKEYVLGLISELGEVLREMHWKTHRKLPRSRLVTDNIGMELADVTKYVFSLWQHFGISLEEMLEYLDLKHLILETRYNQERFVIPDNSKVLFCDLDGTIADWRGTFLSWAIVKGYIPKSAEEDLQKTLMADVDLRLQYSDYLIWKREFEESGMYANLKVFEDGIRAVKQMQENGAILYIHTARPQSQFQRIWYDTYRWLRQHGIEPDILQIGRELRIVTASDIAKTCQVVLFEDDPSLISRAAYSGLSVVARQHKYNSRDMFPLLYPKDDEISNNIKWVKRYDFMNTEQYWNTK